MRHGVGLAGRGSPAGAGWLRECGRRLRERHARRGDAHVRQPVGVDARRVEPLELRAVGGERPAAVERNTRNQIGERHVDPHRHAVDVDHPAVVRVGERAAARGDDDVRIGWTIRGCRVRPPGSTARPAGRRSRRSCALARFDEIVDVLQSPAQAPAPRNERRK